MKPKSPSRCSTDEEIPLSSNDSRGEETLKKRVSLGMHRHEGGREGGGGGGGERASE